MSQLNPFPGYPVVSLTGQLDWTLPTDDVQQARDIVTAFVSQWQPFNPGNGITSSPPRDRAAIILISGDYGSGKTHILVDAANKLNEGFSRRNVSEVAILRIQAIEAEPAIWYQTSIGMMLSELGTRTPDGGWFIRLALQVYAVAAQSVVSNPRLKPENLATNPAAALRLVRDGLLNATAVEAAYQQIVKEACEKVSDAVRLQFLALFDPQRREAAERWLAGAPSMADAAAGTTSAELFTEVDAADVLVAAASLCGHVGWPFALLVDEVEQFLRVDDRNHTERNTTWLKRLLSDLAETGALVGIAGHKSAWDRRPDFLDRFSVKRRIDMHRLSGEEVLEIVTTRVNATDIVFDELQADAVARSARGNVRRILALCRVLFDRSSGFRDVLNESEIKRLAGELAQVATRDQILLRVQEIFEARKLSVRHELRQSSTVRFDLVVQSGAADYFVAAVKNTPAEKEAQDFALQFAAQIKSAKKAGDHITAFFICDTPVDQDFSAIQRKLPGVEFWWIDFTEPMAIDQLRSIVDGRISAEPAAGLASPDVTADVETRLSQRLEDLDRRRTDELRDLYSRLTASLEAKVSAAPSSPPPSQHAPAAPVELTAQPLQPFSAAELFEKPSFAFYLRLTLMPYLRTTLLYLVIGFLFAFFANDIAVAFVETFPVFSRNIYVMTKGLFSAAGLLMLTVPFGLFLKRYIDVVNYFDHARRLMKEFYLTTRHPRLLAGADRVSRELIMLYGPEQALGMLSDALMKLTMDGRPASANPQASIEPTPASAPQSMR